MFWCMHDVLHAYTLDLGLTSHLKDGVHSALVSARSPQIYLLLLFFYLFFFLGGRVCVCVCVCVCVAILSRFDPVPFGTSEL